MQKGNLSEIPSALVSSMYVPSFQQAQTTSDCDKLYNNYKTAFPIHKATLKMLQQQCHRKLHMYDLPNGFKLFNDCPEVEGVCTCGRMHEIEPNDPIIAAVLSNQNYREMVKSLFDICPNLQTCDKLYNVLRKSVACTYQGPGLKQLRRDCYNRLRPDLQQQHTLYDCPEYIGPNQLTPAEEETLIECEFNKRSNSEQCIMSMFPRCNCGNMHFGSALTRVHPQMMRLQQMASKGLHVSAGRSGGQRKSRRMRKKIRRCTMRAK